MNRTLPPYPAGLDLHGRRVVVVGGGSVAQRRIPHLLQAGAVIRVVSPEITATLGALAEAGRISWVEREFRTGDLDGAWYVIAATDSSYVNAQVAAEAEQDRTFCVRTDAVTDGTAVTPSVLREDDMTISVLTADHERSGAARDEVARALTGHVGAQQDEAEALRGTVALVGGGPGADDLLTIRGRRLVLGADVVVVDRLAPQAVLSELRPEVEIVDAAKIPYGRSMKQEAINDTLVDRAKQGKFVVRLKGGDPFLFGRGYEEALACADAGVPCFAVPGVTSALSVPESSGTTVTHRGVTHEVTVVSGHLPPGHPQSLVNWPALAQLTGTIVILMGVDKARQISVALVEGGRDPETPAVVICDGTLDGERRVTATLGTLGETIEAEEVSPPAIIVIGEVVSLPPALVRLEEAGTRTS